MSLRKESESTEKSNSSGMKSEIKGGTLVNERIAYVVVTCFFLFFITLEIYLLITGHKRVASYTLEKAYKEVQSGDNNWIVTLIATIIADIIIWFWLGNTIALDLFVPILIGVDIMAILLAIIEYDTKRTAKRKIREIEQRRSE